MIFFITSDCSAKNNATETIENDIQKYNEKLEGKLNEAFLPIENGNFTGKHEVINPNGNKKSEINYKNGKQTGLATWWDSYGVKERERNYVDEKLNGLETVFRFTGQKMIETNYKDGKKNGLDTGWDDNGRKTVELTWKNEKQNGLQTVWLENNSEIQMYYKNGYEFKSIKPPKILNDALGYSKASYEKKYITYKEIMMNILNHPALKNEDTNTSENKSTKEMQEIKSRCQIQMGEHGAAMVKSCVDQDLEALTTLDSYLQNHKAIVNRCLNTVQNYGYAMVKACADQDIEAEKALQQY